MSEIGVVGTAIIELSEVEGDRGVLEFSSPACSRELNYNIVHYDSPDKRGIDCALLYNPHIFRLSSSGVKAVELEDRPDWKTRDILFATGTIAGELFHFLVAHWYSRSGGESASAPLRMRASYEECGGLACSEHTPIAKLSLWATSTLLLFYQQVAPRGTRNTDSPIGLAHDQYYSPMLRLYNKGLGTLAYRDTWNLFLISSL